MEANVREGDAPAVVVGLPAGERLTSEAGAIMFISGDIRLDVDLPGGVVGGLKRMQSGLAEALFGGEGFFLLHMTGPGHVRSRPCPSPGQRVGSSRRPTAGGGRDERGVGGILGNILGDQEADMGFLDKAKAAAEQAAAKAKEGVEDVQAKRELSQAYNELGKTAFELIESGAIADPALDAHAEKVRAGQARAAGDEVPVGVTASAPDADDPGQPPAMPT